MLLTESEGQKELTPKNKSPSYNIDFQCHEEIQHTSFCVIFLWIINYVPQSQKGKQYMHRNLLVLLPFPFSLNHLFDQLTASVDPFSIQFHSPDKLLHIPQTHCTTPSSPETLREFLGIGESQEMIGSHSHPNSSEINDASSITLSILTCRFLSSTNSQQYRSTRYRHPAKKCCFGSALHLLHGQQLCQGALRLSQGKTPGELTAGYMCSFAHLPMYLCSRVTAEKSVKLQGAQMSLKYPSLHSRKP